MNSRFLRAALITCSSAIILQILALWWLTGRAGLTRFHDPERAAHERRSASIDALLDDATTAPPLAPPNSFALGLLPFGFGRHALSVTTLALPALVPLALALHRARRRQNSSDLKLRA